MRAILMVEVAGTNITSTLMPVLLGIEVTDQVGTHSDTARIGVDDTDGRIVMPEKGAQVLIGLGWEGEGRSKRQEPIWQSQIYMRPLRRHRAVLIHTNDPSRVTRMYR